MRIIILGGGPCGLGAAWRLKELGHRDWLLCEKNSHWGGLSASFQDGEGFWWDIGGHVLFSHYAYFDEVMDRLLGKEEGWLFHKRNAQVWMQERFIPYPMQNHIHHLPKDIYWECLEGIIDIQQNARDRQPAHFKEWILATFGKGVAKYFLLPYNFKVWAWPPEQMDWSWVGERVAPADLKEILKKAVLDDGKKDSWGPNAFFRFPRFGGTGNIWRTLAEKLPAECMALHKECESISLRRQEIRFTDGSAESYDALVSTVPLTSLFPRISDTDPAYGISARELKYSSGHIVGLGLKGNPPPHLADKCWIYFPENNCPFYRVTVFSNYSPHNVADIQSQWSLMLEVSESPAKKVNREQITGDVIAGAVNTGLIKDTREISHTWQCFVKNAYPTPGRGRNAVLFPLLNYLEENNIYSRGRFGAWRYEVANMDHSFMQGVESVNRLLTDGEELSLWYPQIVNSAHPSGRKR
jgi:protoporphyrinogen oxidase